MDGEQARARRAQGFDMISVTTDIDALKASLATELSTATAGQ